MLIAAGSGPGFRFDTNVSQKLEGAGGVRVLELSLPYFGNSNDSGVDLRFHPRDGGLDLCSLVAGGASGNVGLNILFEDEASIVWTVDYSDGCIDHNVAEEFISETVDVTRTGVDTWTIEGVTACEEYRLYDWPGDIGSWRR